MNRIIGIFFALSIYSPSLLGASLLQPASFPTTSMDATFIERRDSAAAGYKPFTNRSAYQPVIIESEQKYMLRHAESVRKSDLASMNNTQYCAKYPLDATRCPQTPGAVDATIAIGDRPQPSKPSETPGTSETASPAPTPPATHVGTATNGQPVIASPHIHDGPCTPPQRSNVFSNKILTSGQYRQSDPAFEKTMITTFRAEGGCGNHPNDSGGYTCYGISQNNNPEVDVRNITRADAERIGHDKYYTRYGIEKLPDNSRGNVFMLGWAGGTITGIHRFCDFLGIKKRNKIDAEVVSAAENYPGDIHNDFLNNQQEFYIQVARRGNNRKFLKGWMNRVQLMRENGCHTPTTKPLTRNAS